MPRPSTLPSPLPSSARTWWIIGSIRPSPSTSASIVVAYDDGTNEDAENSCWRAASRQCSGNGRGGRNASPTLKRTESRSTRSARPSPSRSISSVGVLDSPPRSSNQSTSPSPSVSLQTMVDCITRADRFDTPPSPIRSGSVIDSEYGAELE
jgi:hypothetical protein